MKKKLEKLLLIIFVLSWSVGCDQTTKRVAERTLKGAPIHSMLKDTVRLQYIQNTGAFLGFGSRFSKMLKFWLFLVLPISTLFLMILFAFFSSKLSHTQLFMLMLIVGGGIGNLIDRIFWAGKVTDFVNMGIGSLRTGIFNVADVAIMFGTFGLLAIGLKHAYKEKKEEKRNAIEKAQIDAIIFDEPSFLFDNDDIEMIEEVT